MERPCAPRGQRMPKSLHHAGCPEGKIFILHLGRGIPPETAVDGAASLRPCGSKGQQKISRAFPPFEGPVNIFSGASLGPDLKDGAKHIAKRLPLQTKIIAIGLFGHELKDSARRIQPQITIIGNLTWPRSEGRRKAYSKAPSLADQIIAIGLTWPLRLSQVATLKAI